MILLLTGGTGFFGKAFLRHWMAASAPDLQVTLLSRSPERFVQLHPEFRGLSWLRMHCGDILDPTSLPHAGGFTHLLHAATDSTLGPQLTPLERYSQIVDGTRNMLDYAARHRIPRFLLTSSGGAYGPQPQNMESIAETYHGMPDPLNPEHAYSVAKRCAEHLCALYQQQHGVQTVIARCFAFVGQDLPLDAHFAIGNFIRDALTEPTITVRGDGSPIRSYMDQRDLAHWLDVLLRQGAPGQAYNVGSGSALSIEELAYMVRDLLAPEKSVQIARTAKPNESRNRYVPSIAKAQSALQLHLQYSLPQSIQHTAKMAHPYPQ